MYVLIVELLKVFDSSQLLNKIPRMAFKGPKTSSSLNVAGRVRCNDADDCTAGN